MSADEKSAATKKPLVATVLVVLLSLGTWYFFYLKTMSLAAPDTAVVVGFWLIVVFGAKWLWERFAQKRKGWRHVSRG
jgi:protein-S-isoprenylcysteine O-methyltransferase Ste14